MLKGKKTFLFKVIFVHIKNKAGSLSTEFSHKPQYRKDKGYDVSAVAVDRKRRRYTFHPGPHLPGVWPCWSRESEVANIPNR